MADIPIVFSITGALPTPPATIRAALISQVSAVTPDYTANLPGSLIEDLVSTEVYGIAACDSALIESINCLTPFGANEFVLNEFGQIYGVIPGEPTNTSVLVIFSCNTPGFVIAKGFVISDGTYQYIIQDGGVIGSDGQSLQLFAVASVSGTWPVPAGTVTELITSVPAEITLSVVNPQAGLSSTEAESAQSYRSRVLQAGLVAAQGMPSMLRTLVSNVPGVQPRLISTLQQSGGGWEVIVGGGDPYQVAYAIYASLFDISTLAGSVLNVTGITNANPGVVTVDKNHGYVNGQVCQINGATGISGINGVNITATVIDEKTFSIGINTTSSGAYTGNGVLTPNFRNQDPTINDYPNGYIVPYVNPPQQNVAVVVTWNTTASNFVSAAAMSQAAVPALVNYINSIGVGQPINLLQLQVAFEAAVAPILPPQLLTRLLFSVSINGVGTAPSAGTQIIVGDPESYFETDSTQVVVNQG